MTTDEFEKCLRKLQASIVRPAIKDGLTDEEILCLLKENAVTEESIQSMLQWHRELKSGKRKIPDWIKRQWKYKDTENERGGNLE